MGKEFWKETLDDAAVIVNSCCYHIGDEDSKSPFRGFDGAPWTIEFFDGRTVYTTNLWYDGRIPPEFGVQDNARFGKLRHDELRYDKLGLEVMR